MVKREEGSEDAGNKSQTWLLDQTSKAYIYLYISLKINIDIYCFFSHLSSPGAQDENSKPGFPKS